MKQIAVMYSDYPAAREARNDLESTDLVTTDSVSVHTTPTVTDQVGLSRRTQMWEGVTIGALWGALFGLAIGSVVGAATDLAMASSIGVGLVIGVLYGALMGGVFGARAKRPEWIQVERELNDGRALVVANVPDERVPLVRGYLMGHYGALSTVPTVA